jgi:hypothetical protein
MRFTVSAAALLAFAGAAFAQTDGFDPITKPLKDESIPAGSTYEVTWEASADYNGTVTLILLAGSSASTLQLGDSIASEYQERFDACHSANVTQLASTTALESTRGRSLRAWVTPPPTA